MYNLLAQATLVQTFDKAKCMRSHVVDEDWWRSIWWSCFYCVKFGNKVKIMKFTCCTIFVGYMTYVRYLYSLSVSFSIC